MTKRLLMAVSNIVIVLIGAFTFSVVYSYYNIFKNFYDKGYMGLDKFLVVRVLMVLSVLAISYLVFLNCKRLNRVINSKFN